MALRWKALALAAIPPLLYVVLRAFIPDQYRLSQPLDVRRGTPLVQPLPSASSSTVKDLMEQPEALFQSQFALMELNRYLYRQLRMEKGDNFLNAIREYVSEHMQIEEDGGRIAVVYTGDDLRVGRNLIGYFARQLLVRVGGPGPSSLPAVTQLSERSLWRPDRLVPLLWITIGSLAVVLMVLTILEWADPSLKTVRQTARYLELEVLGVIPDLQRLDGMLARSQASGESKGA
jgi:hypothetical protein